jgi:parallel beta-helix repeat protein
MKQNPILSILAILLTALLAYSATVHTVQASGTVYIRADGSVDPQTAPITTTDNITYIFTGNISESLVIERDNIIIEGADYTIQGTGNDNGNGITLDGRTNVTINHLTITTFNVGIMLTNSNNTQIVENSVTANSQTGISVTMNCFHNNLTGNNVTKTPGVGIWLQGSTSSTLSNNIITGNGDGIYLFTSFNNILSGNTMEGNTYNFGVYGTDLPSFTQSIDTSNVVDGKPVYYLVNQSNTVISLDTYSNAGYLGFVNCGNITVQGMTPPNNVQGVLLAFTSNAKITENNLANNGAGIYLWSSPNNTLSGNNVTNNSYGIISVSSSNNNIFYNTFTNNPTQAYTEDSSDIWDEGYPYGGNHWSDYNGTDIYSGPYQNETESDGIGDSRYTVDPNNIDQYPLMGTYNSFNATPEQTVQAISNSTMSSFTFNGTAISFNISGQTDTAGFCRICIPTALMNGTYRVFVNGTEVTYTTLPCSNSTHTYLYFNYTHSTQNVTIIPELPSPLILYLFIMTAPLALIVRRRKRSPCHMLLETIHTY